MLKLYLVRHAEYDNPENIYPFHLPLQLSKEGRDHAKRVGEWFQNNSIILPIFTSPIVRAVQTSEIISSKIGSFVVVDRRLVETSHASLQGKTIQNKDDWKNQRKLPDREPQENQRDRILAVIYEKIDQNMPAILVSHGDPLSITLMSLVGKSIDPEQMSTDDYIQKGEIVELVFEEKELLSYKKTAV